MSNDTLINILREPGEPILPAPAQKKKKLKLKPEQWDKIAKRSWSEFEKKASSEASKLMDSGSLNKGLIRKELLERWSVFWTSFKNSWTPQTSEKKKEPAPAPNKEELKNPPSSEKRAKKPQREPEVIFKKKRS